MTPTPTDRDMEGQIPEDVRHAANLEAARWFRAIGGDSYHFADAIARAILAEREKAARLIETDGIINQHLAERLAASIRKGG